MKQMIVFAAFAALLSGCMTTGNGAAYNRSYTATSFETVNYGAIGYGYPGSFW